MVVETTIEVPGVINISSESSSSNSQDASFTFVDTTIGSQQTSLNAAAATEGTTIIQQVDVGQSTQNFALSTAEFSLVEERQVILEVLDSENTVIERVILQEDVLDDLPGFFRKLPDGHYRIQLREPGEERLRLIIDVEIRQGKPASGGDEGQDKPPTGEASLHRLPVPVAAVQVTSPVNAAIEWKREVPNDAAATVVTQVSESHETLQPPVGTAVPANAEITIISSVDEAPAGTVAHAGAFAVAGLVVAGANTSWRERVAAAFERAPATEFGRTARLRRRLANALRNRMSH
jgi:hypothetical protein